MPYDEKLASRVRRALARKDVEEKRMFGGLTFMVNGSMCCGVAGDELMLRLGEDLAAEALTEPHVRRMDFTGRPMTGFVFVAADAVASDGSVRRWVSKALTFVETLPAGKKTRRRRR